MNRILKLFFVVCFLYSCDGNKIDNDTSPDGFDRTMLLSNWVDDIIIPAYADFYNSLLTLNTSINGFVENPDLNLLNIVSDDWLISYKKWQTVEMFDIGLAEVINYKGKMNIYPVNTDLILNNVITGVFDINNNNNFTARGFPAIDFMIHGLGDSETDILSFYQNDINYSNYLVELINVMVLHTESIITDWNSSREDFINSTGNTATSSINKMINDFIYYFEKGLRANKVGIPAGVFSNTSLPNNVEAYYKRDVSKELLLEALTASKNFFRGKAFNNETLGLSIEDYLNFLPSSSDNNLASEILSQFTLTENQISLLNNDFVYQIETNNTEMLYTYDSIQLLVVLFKVDMLQALSISVDYVDADGD